MPQDERDVRFAAHSIYQNMPRAYPPIDFSRSQSHSINFVTEDFLAGYMEDGRRMSVVRRFFCLFVTFDLFFISLLWLICILITGDNIYNALKTQILHYSIYTSLFDIVMAAICRFTVLILFYALLYINHWSIIALSTSGSCAFLIAKVFFFNWVDAPQPVFQVLLIVTSFVLSWGEAWFLDCKVIPQEAIARNYMLAATPYLNDDRAPLMAPFLNSLPPESIANFYSPYDSCHNSDEEDDQDDEYRNMGKECVRKAFNLLEASDWSIEKVTSKGDTIKSTQRDKLGKVFRLTARIHFPAKKLLEHLFYKIEDIPKWNPTILESKIIKKIDTHTDISYQATAGAGSGLIKSRDFVNLRCWHVCRDGNIINDSDSSSSEETGSVTLAVTSNQNDSDEECLLKEVAVDKLQKSTSELNINESKDGSLPRTTALSKSLGAKAFFDEDFHSGDECFEDAENDDKSSVGRNSILKPSGKVYVSAAISIPYGGVPTSTKFTRGENLLSCWAMREVEGKEDTCIFEWLLCLDLKGYFPRRLLDATYTSFMQDYMVFLRKYCAEINRKKSHKHRVNS
ncbi:Steroidogenic acute regulatory protein-like [Pseudolycoriella hygida]|uniref:Steroidogenic acute regulatory protein-like n=1 Tax=Pseudolycoriella hygida TaxID=35572 RepID=A0A9Q0N1Z0_9DIPT|nr:Steroidogenic acute regulatory protein-like [Pseudolycoriella hygida]